MENTISCIVKNNLCIGCGVCSAACPQNAITYEKTDYGYYRPSIDVKSCIECGKCYKVCSAKDIECYSLSNIKEIECKMSYSAYSLNMDLRWNSASGGVSTEIICRLLENGLYDDAMVICSRSFSDIKYTDSLKNAFDKYVTQKSRYLPVSHEYAVKTIKDSPSKKYIIMATPCCAKSILNFVNCEQLDRSNYLFIGLFCDGTLSYNVLDYFQTVYSSNKEIHVLNFRDKNSGDWPGNVSLEYGDGTVKYLDRRARMRVKKFFSLERCLYCTMKLNPYVDIAVGDNYIKGEETKEGCNSVILYTTRGVDAWQGAEYSLYTKIAALEEIKQSQHILEKIVNNDYFLLKNPFNVKQKVNVDIKKRIKYLVRMVAVKLGMMRLYKLIYLLSKI